MTGLAYNGFTPFLTFPLRGKEFILPITVHPVKPHPRGIGLPLFG